MLMPPQGLTAGMLFTKIWKTLKKNESTLQLYCSLEESHNGRKNPQMDARSIAPRSTYVALLCWFSARSLSRHTSHMCARFFIFQKKNGRFLFVVLFSFFLSQPQQQNSSGLSPIVNVIYKICGHCQMSVTLNVRTSFYVATRHSNHG